MLSQAEITIHESENINEDAIFRHKVLAEQHAILKRRICPIAGTIKKNFMFNLSNLFNEINTVIDPCWHILDRITDSIYLSQIPDYNRRDVIENTLNNDTIDKPSARKIIISITDYFEQAQKFMIRPHQWKPLDYDHYQLPMNDFSATISIYDLIDVTNYIHAQIHAGNLINVHCKAGRARSALVVVVYLARFGLQDEKINQKQDIVADNSADQEIQPDSTILSTASYKRSVTEYLTAADKLLPNYSDQDIQRCYEILSPVEKVIIAARYVAARRKQVDLHHEEIEKLYDSEECSLSSDRLNFIFEAATFKKCTKLEKAILAVAVCDHLMHTLDECTVSTFIIENTKVVQNLQQDELFKLKLAFSQTFEYKEYLFTYFNRDHSSRAKTSIIHLGEKIIAAESAESLRAVIESSNQPILLAAFDELQSAPRLQLRM